MRIALRTAFVEYPDWTYRSSSAAWVSSSARLRDEIAPELAREERLVGRMGDRQHHGLLPAVRAGLVEDDLHRVVVPIAVEAELDPAVSVLVRRRESGQGPGLLAHVPLGVAGAVAQREELHQLAGVVLVGRALLALQAVEVQQHRRVLGDARHEPGKEPSPRAPEHVVLADHQALRTDGLVRRREPVVPDERHPLRQRTARPHHPVEPPQVVVAELVEREQPPAVDLRRLTDQVVRAGREQMGDGAVEAAGGERPFLARSRAKAGTPEKPLGLGRSKTTRIHGRRHSTIVGGVVGAGLSLERGACAAGWVATRSLVRIRRA